MIEAVYKYSEESSPVIIWKGQTFLLEKEKRCLVNAMALSDGDAVLIEDEYGIPKLPIKFDRKHEIDFVDPYWSVINWSKNLRQSDDFYYPFHNYIKRRNE